MSAIDDLLNKASRRALRRASARMADAIEGHPAQVQAAKSIALYTSKLLCPHSVIESWTMRVFGQNKFAYKCATCKTQAISATKL